ncbi:MAG: hypothetical protein EOO17_03740 [Chloroflexi bacterium]|nr:MAG: hypothetical protein EOO17_03740 [Chloroflexota bacterium]
MSNNHATSRGVTTIELIVFMVVTAILTGLVFTALGDYYQATVSSAARTMNTASNRTSLRTVQDDMTNVVGFLSSSPLTAQAPLGINNSATAWQYGGSSAAQRVLIAQSNATDKPPDDIDRMVVFKPNAGNCNISSAIPIQVHSIYYVAPDAQVASQSNLYRRTIVESATTCPHPVTGAVSVPYQKTTCRTASLAPVCQGNDALILTNVKSFSVDYFVNASDQTPIPDIYLTITNPLTQAAVNSAAAIRLNLTTENKVEGKNETVTSTMRVARKN